MEKNKTMKKIKLYSRKTLALMLTMLMLVSCWVFTPMIEAEGAALSDLYDDYTVAISLSKDSSNFFSTNIYMEVEYEDGTTERTYATGTTTNYNSNDAGSSYRTDLTSNTDNNTYFFVGGSSATITYSASFDQCPVKVTFGLKKYTTDADAYFTITGITINNVSVNSTSTTVDLGSTSADVDVPTTYTLTDAQWSQPGGVIYQDVSSTLTFTSSTVTYTGTLTAPKTGSADYQLLTYYVYDQYSVLMKDIEPFDYSSSNSNYTYNSNGVTSEYTIAESGLITVSINVPYTAQTDGSGTTTALTQLVSRVTGTKAGGYSIKFDITIQDNDYTFTYNDNGGTGGSGSQTENYGTTASFTEPTREGYTFDGYYDTSETKLTTSTTLTEDKTWTAQWSINSYDVTIDADNDEASTTQQVNYNSYLTGITDPEKESTVEKYYTFAGWEVNGDENNLYSSQALMLLPITSATSVVAKYTETSIDYTVTWQNGDGSTLQTDTYAYGVTINAPTQTPTKESANGISYEFTGWEYSDGTDFTTGDTVSNNVTLVPTFKEIKIEYTITLDGVIDSQTNEDTTITVYYGDVISEKIASITPTQDQTDSTVYTFTGWKYSNGATFSDEDTVTGNITLVPVYSETPRNYTITLSGVADDDGNENTEITAAYGSTIYSAIKDITPTKAAEDNVTYEFAGWEYEDGTAFNYADTIAGDVELVPVFKEIKATYTVTVQNEAGDTLATYTVDHGETLADTNINSLNVAKSADETHTYEFKSWVEVDNETNEITTLTAITSNLTIKPTYTEIPIEYTITWLNDDKSEYASKTYNYGDTIVAPTGTPTSLLNTSEYEEWEFAGWETYEDVATLSDEFGTVTGNKTYIATFTKVDNTRTVTLVSKDNETLMSFTVSNGSTLAEMLSTPSLSIYSDETNHYTFDKWVFTTEGYTDKDATTAIITSDVTLKATYTEAAHTYGEATEITAASCSTGAYMQEVCTVEGCGYVHYYTDDETTAHAYTWSNRIEPTATENGSETEVCAICSDEGTTRDLYLISFVNEGVTVSSYVATAGDAITTAPTASKLTEDNKVYSFTGWTTSGTDGVIDFTTGYTPIASTTFTSVFSYVQHYVVSYYANGENKYSGLYAENDGLVLIDETYNPESYSDNYYDYTFSHWAYEDGTEAEDGDKITADTKLIAMYDKTERKVSVTYDAQGGTIGGASTYTQTQTAGTGYDATIKPTKTADANYSYTFSHWSLEKDGTAYTGAIYEDITLYAVYTTGQIHTVTLYNGTEKFGEISVVNGATIEQVDLEEIGTPTKTEEGLTYKFAYWSTSETGTAFVGSVTSDISLYAVYTQTQTYTITFYDENGTTILDTLSVSSEEMLTATDLSGVATPTKATTSEGAWVFDGWTYADGSAVTTPTYITSNLSMIASYAKIDEVTYTVTFLDYDGTVLYTGEYGFNDYFYNTPTVESRQIGEAYYTFTGWKEETTGYTTVPSRITSNLTYVAQYTVVGNTYEVKFLNYDGSEILVFPYVQSGATVQYTGSTPEKTADTSYCYTFLGWYDSVYGGNEVTSFANVTSDIVVYAQYTSTAHSFTTTISKVATCTENGGTYSYCEHCGYERVTSVTPSTGHTYTLINSTDLGDNTYEYTYLCKTCGEYYITQYTDKQVTKYTISLCYDDTAHTAINYAKIVVYDSNNTQIMSTYTDSTGSATVYVMDPGEYTLYITGTTFKDSFGTLTMDEGGNITVEIDEIEMNACSCTCHTDGFWANIFRFFHNIFKIFTGGEISCCGCPDDSYYE